MDEGFTIREATPADKEGVLLIREEATDYLRDYFDHFMTSEHMTSFVLCYRDRIVGFNVAFIVDNGQTLVERSSRIHPDFEGRGLFRELDRHTIQWAKDRHVQIKAITTSDENKHLQNPSFQSLHKLVITMNIFSYFVEVKDIHPIRGLNTDVVSVTESLMYSYIDSKQTYEYLFPGNRFLVDGVPFKLMHTNIPLMFEQKKNISIFSNISKQSDMYKGILSVGTLQHVKKPSYVYNIELYGADNASLIMHINRHMDVIKTRASEMTCVFVFVPDTIEEKRIDDIFHNYNISRKVWLDPTTKKASLTKRLVFEKVL